MGYKMVKDEILTNIKEEHSSSGSESSVERKLSLENEESKETVRRDSTLSDGLSPNVREQEITTKKLPIKRARKVSHSMNEQELLQAFKDN